MSTQNTKNCFGGPCPVCGVKTWGKPYRSVRCVNWTCDAFDPSTFNDMVRHHVEFIVENALSILGRACELKEAANTASDAFEEFWRAIGRLGEVGDEDEDDESESAY